uniref:Probable magnesium transporter n=1 Tax=Nicotiana tabacum TaxID=4097 RepID=A0A1S3YI83_TOBAC|nr:PREDICTED: probable magnesium transporter NIPA6 [Nicotiana tabacum]
MYSANLTGFILAVVSSAFIGSSFIIKKKGLQKAGSSGTRASSGGYGYLREPLWWIGMIIMIAGEFANFVAYIYAPAVLVTPLGALSIIVSAVLAHFLLKEKLKKLGVLGCVLCIVGSTVIVLHAPGEHDLNSVDEIWALATQPAFLLYTASAVAITLVLVLYCEPRYGQTNIMVYIGVCSIFGSLTVMSIKAIGIAIKLTLEGSSQVAHLQTWVFVMVAVTCIITQLNYLNKALDTFNTAVVSPIYYAMFTSLTILASAIMFKVFLKVNVWYAWGKSLIGILTNSIPMTSIVGLTGYNLNVTKSLKPKNNEEKGARDNAAPVSEISPLRDKTGYQIYFTNQRSIMSNAIGRFTGIELPFASATQNLLGHHYDSNLHLRDWLRFRVIAHPGNVFVKLGIMPQLIQSREKHKIFTMLTYLILHAHAQHIGESPRFHGVVYYFDYMDGNYRPQFQLVTGALVGRKETITAFLDLVLEGLPDGYNP